MTELKFTTPTPGELNTVAEPLVDTGLNEIKTFMNGKNLDSTTNIKEEGITEASLSAALKTKLAGTVFGLTVKESTEASVTGANGEFIIFLGAGGPYTLTLPTPTAGRTLGCSNFLNTGKVIVSAVANGGKIIGDFVEESGGGAKTVELTLHQHLLLTANGTAWFIQAGEPAGGKSWGRINGTTGAVEEGSKDFTAAKLGTGEYELKWTIERPTTIYALVITTIGGAPTGFVFSTSKTTAVIKTTNFSSVSTNATFNFICLA
jgi:hypothetical protein